MTAATATRYEILEDRVERGERHVRYRWTIGESSGIDTAMERTEPLSRDLLEDRWRGLIGDGDYTELGEQLSNTLMDLSDGLTRRSTGSPDTVRIENDTSIGLDTVMDIDGLMDTIQHWMIERAAKVAAA